MKLTRFQKMRIIILLAVTAIGFSSYFYWYYRTVNIMDIPIFARMQKEEFSNKNIAILPLGKIQIEDVSSLVHLFKQLYGINVTILKSQEIPPETFIKSRNQYNAMAINQYLRKQKDDYFKVIGITDEDITVSVYNYVFGLASLNNDVFTVSINRLRGKTQSEIVYRSRLFKIILHEYGHTFALGHCQGSGICLMKEIDDLEALDAFPCGFCWICNNRVR